MNIFIEPFTAFKAVTESKLVLNTFMYNSIAIKYVAMSLCSFMVVQMGKNYAIRSVKKTKTK